MKLRCLALAAVLSALPLLTASAGVRLFILSGQSNMFELDPEESFGPALRKAFPNDEILIVKEAVAVQAIRGWYRLWTPGPNGPFVKTKGNGAVYKRLMEGVNRAIDARPAPVSITFVWMQGEADAKAGGDVYEDSLRGLIAQLREEMKRPDITVVVGRLTDFSGGDRPLWTTVREAQVKVASEDRKAAWVDTDDLNGPANTLLVTKEGSKTLGERFAEKAIILLKGGKPAVAAPAP